MTFSSIEALNSIPSIKEIDDNETNPTVYLKFQNILGRGTWYAIALEAIKKGTDALLFGYVISPLGEDCDEWGYFTLSELNKTHVIQLDHSFEPKPIKELVPEVITWTAQNAITFKMTV